MKTRALFLILFSANCLFGQYVYDYTGLPTTSGSWTANGAVDYDYSQGIDFWADGGSFIYSTGVSGGNSNDYEVSATFYGGAGTLVEFLRASSNAVRYFGNVTSGSFISVEVSSAFGLAVYQCINGSVTQLGSASVYPPSGHLGTLRSVIFGTTLEVFLNNQLVYTNTSMPATTGQPGVGGYDLYPYPGWVAPDILSVSIGHHDTVAPVAPSLTGFRSSILPTSVSLAWQPVADDPIGIGFYRYNVSRNGSPLAYVTGTPLLSDSTVAPATSYSYAVSAVDYHGNVSATTTINITTPPASAVDPRRTGLYTTGSYWGGGGEQIDTLSGNLNFSIPLIKPMGRTGWSIPIGLSYNSQNWRQDGSYNWSLGTDTGYGYGWTLQIGSIAPYYAGWTSGVDHYVYTDGAGAEYRLDQNNGGVWTSLQGIYVWFDSGTNELHFPDGKFWVMGCTSSGVEQDAGTMYPTILQDLHGNQIVVIYQAAVGLPSGMTNTSARIVTVQDVRAVYLGFGPSPYASYSLSYNTDPIPHLTGVSNWIRSGETFPSFVYAKNVALGPPFGSTDANYSGVTTTHLTNIVVPAAGPTSSSYPAAGQYTFTYDSAGAAELDQVTFPYGGHLRWVYSNAVYAGSRQMREVGSRYLAADAAGAVEWGPYPFTHSDTGNILTVHTDTTLADASGVGAKTWTFNSSGPAWQIGLAATFTQLWAVSGTAMTSDAYTWSQTGGSAAVPKIGPQPYISAKTHNLDPGGTNAQSALTNQTMDAYGNTLTMSVFPYNSTSAALQAYQTTYATGYPSLYVLNLPLTTQVTTGGVTKTISQSLYDSAGYTSMLGTMTCSGYSYGLGLATQTWTPSVTKCIQYDGYGNVYAEVGSDGSSVIAPSDSSTNYAAPTSLTTESYNYSVGYNAWLGLGSSTGANGEQVSTNYDTYGRPVSGTSAFGGYWGGITSYSYPTSAVLPTWQGKQGGGGYTYTLLDGLGRAGQVKRGPSTGPQSLTDSVYAPCACSPMGKLQKTSQPTAVTSGVAWGSPDPATPSGWTAYTYDGIGRTLSVTQPDGVSVTTYSYSGNQTTVTDPAGNWKKFTTDVMGNLTTVTEPDPANLPGGTVTTTYTYDWMNHLTSSVMTRNGTTQTRTFVYSDAGQMTSATNPESGTVTYTYNTTGTLAAKLDANGVTSSYGYDSANRLIGAGTTACNDATYTYGTDPTQFNYGRLINIAYGTTGATCVPGTSPTSYGEQYTYNYAGAVASKTFWMDRVWTDWNGDTWTLGEPTWWESNIQANYSYDYWGNMSQEQYSGSEPFSGSSSTVDLQFTRDTMGRASGMTDGSGGPVWVQGITYDLANRMTQIQYPQYSSIFDYMTESKAYNVNGELSSMTWTPGVSGQGAPSGTISYAYTGTGHSGNNGQIAQATDGVSGETISYQYDALKRLLSASSSPTSGSTPAAWTQNYSYDGFGNLTGKGSSMPIPVNSATNQMENQTGVLSNVSYDSNGNLLSATRAGSSGLTMTYDGLNRVASATVGSGTEYYGYDASGHRIYRKLTNGTEEWSFYGIDGKKLGTFSMVLTCGDWTDPSTCYYQSTVKTTNIWFGSKLVWSGTGSGSGSGPDFTDRLGTNRANGARFYPYGDEITSTGNDHVKFGTYERSSVTGLDYASARYYASAYGRFTSVDPDGASASPKNPGSWNRYAYAGDDPVNRNDPSGKISCADWFYYMESTGTYDGTDDDVLGNCGPGLSNATTDFNPCSVNPELLMGSSLSCDNGALPPCEQASSVTGCTQNNGNGGEGAAPVPGQGGGGSPAAYWTIVENAQQRAEAELGNPTCGGLFGTSVSDPAFSMQTAAIKIAPFGGDVPPGVGGFTANDAIWLASNRYFFSGLNQDGTSVLTDRNSVFFGLTYEQMQDVILIHELLHLTGVAGQDAQGQAITLGNGQIVNGSAGITAAVIQDCL